MRRTPISQYWRVIRRSGVIARVVRTRISVQSPVECVMTSMGLAPRPSCSAFQTSRPSGTSAARKTIVFVSRRRFIRMQKSKVRLQKLNLTVERVLLLQSDF
jgi:hypothetical protein